jgi:hypothetical protein
VADTITVKFKVLEDGSLKAIGQYAEKAAKSTDKATKSSDNYSKKQKGVAGATSNGTKAFSKMTTGITGGLVPAYATLAANVFAVSAAFNFFKRAADVQILEQSQIRYASSTGLGLQSITQGLRDASNGMLGFREAAEAAAIGVAKGFSPKQLEDLAMGAQRASAALGRGFEDAFDRLIRGASKAEPELLDELGITLRLKTATESYAKSLGVQADALTATQRSQAVLLETQRQLDELFGTGPAETNPFTVLAKTFEDLTRSGTDAVMPMIKGLVSIINTSGMAAIAVFGALGLSILKSMVPANMVGDAIEGAMAKSQRATEEAIGAQMSYAIEVENSQKALDELARSQSQKTAGAALGAGAGKSKLVTKLSKGEDLSPMQKGRVKKMLKDAEIQYKLHGEIVKGTFKGMDIAIVTDMKKSFLDMDKSKVSFFKRMKQSFKKGRLVSKTAFAQIQKGGTKAFQSLGKAVGVAGNAIGKMMKMAGFIGILVMIFEAVKKVAQAPFTIISNALGAFDTAANFILDTFKGPLVGIAKMVDFIKDKYAGFLNLFIGGYNKIANSFAGKKLGMTELEEFERGSTSAADAMLELAEAGINTKKVFQTGGFGQSMLEWETSADKANLQTANLEATLEMFKKMGADVNSTVSGLTSSLTEVTDAEKGVIVATSMGSLSLSDRIKKIYETTQALDASGKMMKFQTLNDADREEAMRALRREMVNLKTLSPQMAAAFNDPDLEEGIKKMAFIEVHSRNATTEMKAFRDGIEGVTSAIGDGNLKDAEFLLNTLKDSAASAAESYRKLGDDASLAAANAAEAEYANALGEAIGDTNTYHASLIALRVAQESHNIATKEALFLSGSIATTRKLEIDVAGKQLALDEVTRQLQGVKIGQLREELLLKQKLLGLDLQASELKLIEDTQGSGMAAAQASANIMASDGFQNAFRKTIPLPEGQEGPPQPAPPVPLSERIGAMGDALSPMSAELAKLGPEGEAMSAALSGATVLAETFMSAFEQIGDKGLTLQDGLGMAAGAVQALGAMQAAKSKAAIAGIDKEIAAEKARDGNSAASVAKIAAMEKKKDAMKRKAFEQDKKMKMASTVIATATGMMNAFAHSDPLTATIMATMIGAMGAAQLGIISGMTYQGGSSSAPAAPSKISAGSRSNTVDLANANNAGGEQAYMRGESGVGSGMSNFKPAFTGYKHRAGGGYVVGEQGPELFMPETPGEIIPSGKDTGGTTNVNFSISAVDATGVEELLTAQKGNIIGMIREAANEHGELFLETVKETSY